MNVLIACEESQAVCVAFRQRGHESFSCDIQPCSGGYPEWHILGDVLRVLNCPCSFSTMDGCSHYVEKWDLIIGFPPCTYVSNAGARHLFPGRKLDVERFYKGMCGKALFESIRHADCEHIAIENPVPSRIFGFDSPSQIIQPYMFGHPFSKRTCLWLKGLPELVPTEIVLPVVSCHDSGTWFTVGGVERQKNRSKLCSGFAAAMAEQWGDFLD